MRNRRAARAALVLAASLPLLACRAPTPFEVQDEPFEGSYEGTFAFTPEETNGETGEVVTAELGLEVVGQATHLGPSDLQGVLRLDFREEPSLASGRLELLASNGDEMRLELEGRAVPTGFIGGIEIEGTLRVVGGTGRFQLARGEGDLWARANLLVGEGLVTASGVLSY